MRAARVNGQCVANSQPPTTRITATTTAAIHRALRGNWIGRRLRSSCAPLDGGGGGAEIVSSARTGMRLQGVRGSSADGARTSWDVPTFTCGLLRPVLRRCFPLDLESKLHETHYQTCRRDAGGTFRRRPARPSRSSDDADCSDLRVRGSRSGRVAPLRARRSRHLSLLAIRQSDGDRGGRKACRPRSSRGCGGDCQWHGGRVGRRAGDLPGRRRTGQHARCLRRNVEDVSAGAVTLRHQSRLRSI